MILFNSQVSVFQCFSLMSAMVCGGIAGFYLFIAFAQFIERAYGNPGTYDAEMALLIMIFILGIIECCVGCGATVSVYRMMICCFSSPPPEVRHIYNSPFRTSATQYMFIFWSIWILQIINFLPKQLCYRSLLRGKQCTNLSLLSCPRHMKRDSMWRTKTNRYNCSLLSWWNFVVVLYFSRLRPPLSGHPPLRGQLSKSGINQPLSLS